MNMSTNNLITTITLIVTTLSLQTVTVNGNCMGIMNKLNPIKKAMESSYKEMCSKCQLKVVSAELDAAFDKGISQLLVKVGEKFECKEKDDLTAGLTAMFKDCIAKLKDGDSMCQKDTFGAFNKCAEDKVKEKDIMKKLMACCNDSGVPEVIKLLDCGMLDTVAGLKGKKMLDKSVRDWDKCKLKCESGVTGHETVAPEFVGYMKNCG